MKGGVGVGEGMSLYPRPTLLQPNPPHHQSVFNRNLDLFLSCSTAFGWGRDEGRGRWRSGGGRNEWGRDGCVWVEGAVTTHTFFHSLPYPPYNPYLHSLSLYSLHRLLGVNLLSREGNSQEGHRMLLWTVGWLGRGKEWWKEGRGVYLYTRPIPS